MCNSDTELIMFHWAKGLGAPVPDFSTAVSDSLFRAEFAHSSIEFFLHDFFDMYGG